MRQSDLILFFYPSKQKKGLEPIPAGKGTGLLEAFV